MPPLFPPHTPRFIPKSRQPLTGSTAPTAPDVRDWRQPLSYSRERISERATLAELNASFGRVGRGGVAYDANGSLLPPWQQPLSYNVPSRCWPAIILPREGS